MCLSNETNREHFGEADFSDRSLSLTSQPTHEETTPQSFDVVAWEKLNPWLTEGQPDDRLPLIGSAANGHGSSSARRSTARRTHQMMFKKWSQARHD